MASKQLAPLVVATALLAVLACDDDPTRPDIQFALTQCPAGLQTVNAPIALTFTQPVASSSVAAGNVVVTDAATGIEIPGSLARSTTDGGRTITFTPSDQLPFDTLVRVRVHNLLEEATNTALDVTVCEIRTELPPIQELFWEELPEAGGVDLLGASLIEAEYGYVIARTLPIFAWRGGPEFVALPQQPYFSAGYDVSFVSRTHGFATIEEQRERRSVIVETLDGGLTYDTIGTAGQQALNRAYFRPIPNATTPFGVVAGGQSFSPAFFMKWQPATRTFAVSSNSGTGGVNDLDFASNDTTKGAAATLGLRLGTRDVLGTLFVSSNGGLTWTEVTAAKATPEVLFYRGVAVRQNGDIFLAGGNGYLMRWRPAAGGGNSGAGYDTTRFLAGAVTNPDPSNPNALLFTDVQFAPDNDLLGWVIGAQQVGTVGGTPRFQGLIFVTRDGGNTWTRQGVRGAPGFGAEFPRLNRISIFSANAVWIAGDGGTVLDYRPPATP